MGQPVEQTVDYVRSLISDRQWSEAEDLLAVAVAEFGEISELMRVRAMMYAMMHKWGLAVETMAQCLECDTCRDGLKLFDFVFVIQACLNADELDQALAFLEIADLKFPNSIRLDAGNSMLSVAAA